MPTSPPTRTSAVGFATRRSPPQHALAPQHRRYVRHRRRRGTAFIVMELVEWREPASAPRPEAARSTPRRRLDRPPGCRGARPAHRNGIVHRDIKPANVLVPREGSVKVTDFGIAEATGSADFTRTGMVVGTTRYLSPEQVQGHTSDTANNVYTLGLVLYEMLAGRPAYEGDSEMATAVAGMSGRRRHSHRSAPVSRPGASRDRRSRPGNGSRPAHPERGRLRRSPQDEARAHSPLVLQPPHPPHRRRRFPRPARTPARTRPTAPTPRRPRSAAAGSR